ncbi:putative diphthamide synthesis protein-domain-containing protein [Hysterangium stoloniferum]|nr:putative diphthamide synthesis protein-domain-containing protein [Hysterangium stoloniferum]
MASIHEPITKNLKTANASKPRKRFVGRTTAGPSKRTVIARQIPEDILNDLQLNQAIQQLPQNYSFEIHKTIHHIRKNNARMVALQMPEGLQMFACAISDIIERFTDALTIIMGDVTYGACCIDDYTAVALGCDMLIHYGHSCLVPIDQTAIKTLYIFVEIAIDSTHLTQTIRLNLPDDRHTFQTQLLENTDASSADIPAGKRIEPQSHVSVEGTNDSDPSHSSHDRTRLALVSTIQFVAPLQKLKEDLSDDYTGPPLHRIGLITAKANTEEQELTKGSNMSIGAYDITIPQSKPLSPGEVLGCTAPRLGDIDALLYLGDGRFHLESIMIANPHVPAFRYDPYSKKLTREYYDHREMTTVRHQAVQTAQSSLPNLVEDGGDTVDDLKPVWGVVLGTLGRQGSFKQLQAITHQLSMYKRPIPYVPILLSELSPAKLKLFSPHISTFVQTSCPRLSIDWGYAFDRPLLSPYEVSVAVGRNRSWMEPEDGEQVLYPMDFYAAASPWTIARLKGKDDSLVYM